MMPVWNLTSSFFGVVLSLFVIIYSLFRGLFHALTEYSAEFSAFGGIFRGKGSFSAENDVPLHQIIELLPYDYSSADS